MPTAEERFIEYMQGGGSLWDYSDPMRISRQSAEDSMASQERIRQQINAMYEPYYQAGTGAWQDYAAMTTGGEYSAPMSPQYQMELDRNTTATNRAMAGRGLFNSSARGAALGDVSLMAGQNEAARQYGQQLDLQRLGTGAIGGLGRAGQSAGANIGATYGNLGSNLNSLYQFNAQQQGQDLRTGANALYGLGSYLQQQEY